MIGSFSLSHCGISSQRPYSLIRLLVARGVFAISFYFYFVEKKLEKKRGEFWEHAKGQHLEEALGNFCRCLNQTAIGTLKQQEFILKDRKGREKL
jgi:hypothetical protein